MFSRINLKEVNDAMLRMESKALKTAIDNKILDPAKKDYQIIYSYID